MKYRVDITEAALSEIADVVAFIAERSPENVESWLNGLYARIDTLEFSPRSCPVALESRYSNRELRHLILHVTSHHISH